MIQQSELSDDSEINLAKNGSLIKANKKARQGWGERLKQAINAGNKPDGELLEGFDDELAHMEWQW